MTGENFQEILFRELHLLAEPVLQAGGSPAARQTLIGALGWELEAITGLRVEAVDKALADFAKAFSAIDALRNPPNDLAGLRDALAAAGAALDGIRALGALGGAGAQRPPGLDRLGPELLELVFVYYLFRHHRLTFELLVLLSLLEPADEAAPPDAAVDPASSRIARFPRMRPTMRLDRLVRLVHDPGATLAEAYLPPRGLHTAADAKALSDRLFPRLANVFGVLGASAVYGVKPSHNVDFGSPTGNQLAATMLTVLFAPDLGSEGAGSSVGATFAISTPDLGGLGVVVVPHGELQFAHDLVEWRLVLEAAAGLAFAFGPGGVTVAAGSSPEGRIALELSKLPSDGAAVRVGSMTGSRLEIGGVSVHAATELSARRSSFDLGVDAHSGVLVLAPGDGDGFLKKILPAKGLRLGFDLGVGWSSAKGVHLRGAAGLEATLPVKADLLRVLRVDALHMGLRAGSDRLATEISATVTVKLGPVTATVERIGLEALLAFPKQGGNLGPADLALHFKPPSGAALDVQAGFATGGGYLFYDAAAAQYAGALHLKLGGKLAVNAIGILTTRMPDRSPGFSLLLIITAQGFAPIQLGFGFTLNGIGGVLGVNRTVNAEAVRAGIKTGAVDSVLFPADPVRNAPAIVSNLNALMPAAPDRFLIGPIGLIGWGTPTLMTVKLAILLEIPQPVRLSILGRLSVLLPEGKNPLIKLQLDAFGRIDFEKGDLAFDASLYDSRVLQWVLTGSMALRANWGSNPGFLLAVGGFNPRFPAPAGFPRMERVSVSLAEGGFLKLRLAAYFALTSNTLQFGARLDLAVSAAGFTLEGMLSIDALIQFSPFQFVADFAASLSLRAGGTVLFSVRLDGTLAGPSPWHIRGSAHFSILFFSFSIAFDVSFGPALQPPPPVPVDVTAILRTELSEVRNWSSELPSGTQPLVSLLEVPGGGVLVHPLGTLSLRQRRVPLNRSISRFGSAVPLGGRRAYRVDVTTVAGAKLPPVATIDDLYARAQFETMTDAQKLSAPSFEKMASGFRFGSESIDCPDALALAVPVEYETLAYDPLAAASPGDLPPYRMPPELLDHAVAGNGNASARNAARAVVA